MGEGTIMREIMKGVRAYSYWIAIGNVGHLMSRKKALDLKTRKRMCGTMVEI